MNPSTRQNFVALVLAGGATLGAWSPTCFAQTEPPNAEKQQFASVRTPSAPITIRFQGGLLAEYVKAVQAQRGDNTWPVNVILGPGTDRIVVRPVDLKFVSVDTAMEALVFAAECSPGELRIDHVSAHEDESPTFSVIRKDNKGQVGTQDLEVLSIAQLTNPTVNGVVHPALAIKPDVILSAVELALPTGEEQARVKYHEESHLLILQGSSRATNAVHQVIKTMIDDQRQRLGDAGVSLKQMIESKARVERAEIQVKRRDAELAVLQGKLDQLSKFAQQGTVSDTEVQEARSQVDQAEAALLTARSDLQEATALAELLAKPSVVTRSDNTSDELASLRKLVEDQAAQIKALTEELASLRKQKNTK